MFTALHSYINAIESVVKLFEKIRDQQRKQRVLDAPFGDTLQKVAVAQEHLVEALEAMDIIREQAVTERSKLDSLLTEVEQKRKLYRKTTVDLETTQDLLDKDQEKLRSALGINTSREKFIGFVSGVIASITATAIWYLGSMLWTWFSMLQANQ